MKSKHNLHDFIAGVLVTTLVVSMVLPAGAAMASKSIDVLTGAEIYVDGTLLKPTDVNGNPVETFIYNGTTYVPLRAVSQSLGKAVSWDGENQRVYIGSAPGIKQYLNTICPPYQTKRYDTPTTVEMAGNKYANAIQIGMNQISGYDLDGWALYNLNGQYETLRFTLGHVDGGDMDEGTLNIYLDGQLSFSMDLDPTALPEDVEVSLHNALQMKIEVLNGNDFALAEAEIY